MRNMGMSLRILGRVYLVYNYSVYLHVCKY